MSKHDDHKKDKHHCDDKHDHKHEHKHHHKDHDHDKDDCKKHETSCNVESVRVYGTSSTETIFPKTIKVPVTLAEVNVVVCVEANIHLEKPALEIIRVWKSAILENCELIPTFNPLSAKLFVSGFIRKNIEYATVDHTSSSSVCGDIRHTTAMIPFDLATDITFPPKGPTLQHSPDFSSSSALLNKKGTGEQVNASLYGNRLIYNEKPYCELAFTEFTELDVGQGLKKINAFTKSFTTVNEKIVLRLGLNVMQDQHVPIPVACPTPPPPTHPPHACTIYSKKLC